MTKLPIRPVLEHYGALDLPHGRGGWVKLRCILHEENNASATFSEEKQAFKCFACDVYEDAVGIIRIKEGLDYTGAVARGEEITGIKGGGVQRPTAQPVRLRPARLSDDRPGAVDGNHREVPAGGRRKPRRIG